MIVGANHASSASTASVPSRIRFQRPGRAGSGLRTGRACERLEDDDVIRSAGDIASSLKSSARAPAPDGGRIVERRGWRAYAEFAGRVMTSPRCTRANGEQV